MDEDFVTVYQPEVPDPSEPSPEVSLSRPESTAESIEEKEESDIEETESIEEFNDPEALKYVVGSLFRRLDCEDCRRNLCSAVDSSSSSGLLALRVYERAHLLDPDVSLLRDFGQLMPQVFAFVQTNVHIPQIAHQAANKFPLKRTHRFCSASHSFLIMLLFTQLLIRRYCKQKNENLRSTCRRRSRLMTIYDS